MLKFQITYYGARQEPEKKKDEEKKETRFERIYREFVQVWRHSNQGDKIFHVLQSNGDHVFVLETANVVGLIDLQAKIPRCGFQIGVSRIDEII